MNPTHNSNFDAHEKVLFVNDDSCGLRAIIAVHNTQLGPALGGCRVFPYESRGAALSDVLRLSRGMSFKSAMAGLPLGGGKSVIMAKPDIGNKAALLKAMAEAVRDLQGEYIIAQDSGTTTSDMRLMAETTRYVAGGARTRSASGEWLELDPSPSTAQGVFEGLKAAVAFHYGVTDLRGLRVAVQGLGNVGYALAKALHQAGAELFVQDINACNVERAVDEFGAHELVGEQIYRHKADVFAPCALGGVLGDKTIAQLNCSIVAGAANNQLQKPRHGLELAARSILYVPDYVLNAGGIIRLHHERQGNSAELAHAQVGAIGNTVRELLQRARHCAERPECVADRMAQERIRPQPKVVDAAVA